MLFPSSSAVLVLSPTNFNVSAHFCHKSCGHCLSSFSATVCSSSRVNLFTKKFKTPISLDVNGERHQTGNTNQMIFNFNFLISHISNFITLMPGDIVTTGTPPGVGMGMSPPIFLKDGDKMNLKVENLGQQTSIVRAE